MKARRAAQKELETRAVIGERFKALCLDTGLDIEGIAKLLHVTTRTVRNWKSGNTAIPYAAYKLLRVLRLMELPGKGFENWCMHSGKLWTPEGRPIEPADGAWWSLLVRQAQGFRTLYARQTARTDAAPAMSGTGCGAAAPGQDSSEAAGLVSYKTSHPIHFSEEAIRRHDDVKITSWPTLYDFPHSLMSPLEIVRTTSESASTPLSVSPWTPTCGIHLSASSRLPAHLVGSKAHLKQVDKTTTETKSHKATRTSPSSQSSQSSPAGQARPPSSPGQKKSGCTSCAKSSSDRVSAKPGGAYAPSQASAAGSKS